MKELNEKPLNIAACNTATGSLISIQQKTPTPTFRCFRQSSVPNVLTVDIGRVLLVEVSQLQNSIAEVIGLPSSEKFASWLEIQLREHGLLIFPKLFASVEDAREWTMIFGDIVRPVDVLGTEYLGYHGELAYTPFSPDLLCFFCEAAPPPGVGQTMFCDGEAVWRGLSQATRQLLSRKRLRMESRWSTEFLFRRLHVDSVEALQAKLKLFEGDTHCKVEGDSITLIWITHAAKRSLFRNDAAFVNSILVALHDPRGREERPYSIKFEDGLPIPQAVVREAHEVSESLTFEHAWSRGDYIIVENTRMMHGRRHSLKGNIIERKLLNFHTNIKDMRNTF